MRFRRLPDAVPSWLIHLTPPLLLDKILEMGTSFRFWRSAERTVVAQNLQWKNTASQKRAFLLVTGPSIKHEDLSVLRGEDCFSASNFFLHEETPHLKPKIHFFAPFHAPLVLENYVEWLQKGHSILPQETQIFLGHSTKWIVEKYHLFEGRKIHYLFLGGHPSTQHIDICQPLQHPQSVPLMMLPVLIYMGYQEIYLLGCDHTVMRDYGKQITHFYDSKKEIRKNASDIGSWSSNILDILYANLVVFEQYKFYTNLAAQHYNCRIINLSSDTWLNFIEQKRLSEVISPTLL